MPYNIQLSQTALQHQKWNIFVDTCAMQGSLSHNLLREFSRAIRAHGIAITPTFTRQLFREQTNASTPGLLKAAKEALKNSKLEISPGQDGFILKGMSDNSDIAVTNTPVCDEFYRQLTSDVIPSKLGGDIFTYVYLYRQALHRGEDLTQEILDLWKDSYAGFHQDDEKISDAKAINLLMAYDEYFFHIARFSQDIRKEFAARFNDAPDLLRNSQALSEDMFNCTDPFVIQAMRFSTKFHSESLPRNAQALFINPWHLLRAAPSLVQAHHDCADTSMIAYLAGNADPFPDPSAFNIIVTEDIPFIKRTAQFDYGQVQNRMRDYHELNDEDFTKHAITPPENYALLPHTMLTTKQFLDFTREMAMEFEIEDSKLEQAQKSLSQKVGNQQHKRQPYETWSDTIRSELDKQHNNQRQGR